MQRPLDHCVLAAQSVPRGQQSMACWPLLVCVCVSVWMYRLSKLSGQCHRRSLQLVCLSGLVQLSVLPVSPAVLSAAWLGNAALGLMECCCADLEDLCRLAGAEPKEICTAGKLPHSHGTFVPSEPRATSLTAWRLAVLSVDAHTSVSKNGPYQSQGGAD